MNRCLHNTAHPADGGVISSHYGGLHGRRDPCGRTERVTSSPPDRAHGGLLTRVVLLEEPKVGFPFHEVSSWCAGNPKTCVRGSECQGPSSGHGTGGTMSRKVQDELGFLILCLCTEKKKYPNFPVSTIRTYPTFVSVSVNVLCARVTSDCADL